MASPVAKWLFKGLGPLLLVLPAAAQVPTGPATAAQTTEALDMSLSSECRVPGSKLYTLAPLSAVRAALEESRPIRVLALGPSGAGSVSGSPSATYPSKLQGELQKILPGVEAVIEQRSLPGEITAESKDRFMAVVAEVEPDLLLWQVGTNDALAKADIDAFTGALNEILEWLNRHGISVVLIEPSFHSALALDEHYNALGAAIQSSARQNEVPLVMRFEAMRFLSQQKTEAAKSQFRLNDLGYRCMAEHVARTISLSILEPAPSNSAPTEQE